MPGDSPISLLMFFTLVAGVVIIAGAFIAFNRSRTNRQISAEAIAGSRPGPTPHGAGAELVGFGVIALAVMGLLAAGYSQKSSFETAQKPGLVGTTTGMAQPAGTAEQPKKYQPENPAPDNRAAPTSSNTGAGPENGNTGAPK
jgi:hypothetical protein